MVKSMKPGKQRKAHFNAPMHEKRKRVAARLQLKDRDERFDGVRTVTVRVGDTVKVVRGDLANGGKRHGGKRGADPLVGTVIRVDSEKGSPLHRRRQGLQGRQQRRGGPGPLFQCRRRPFGRD